MSQGLSRNNGIVIKGETDSGDTLAVPVTPEGHLEVAVHSPRLPFGSLHTENLTPIFQADAVYGVNSQRQLTTTSGSGTASAGGSAFYVSTGATIYSQASIQSRKRLRYRPGQGVVGRFTALFTTGVANSYQVAGFGHAEDGVYFGYKNDQFGILYSSRGIREVQTLTITTGATVAANCTITLNGTAFTVALSGTGTTAADRIQRTAYEIASFANYTGFTTTLSGSTVIFVANDVGNKIGAFTFGAGTTGAAAAFAETTAGVASGETFVPQSSWNGDKLDGTGYSGSTIDPTKFNVFQIGIQYLGAGSITFQVEIAPSGNNPEFVTVHTLRLPNTLTATSFGNPSFPFTMAAYSAGSTTDLILKVGSYAGFIEGQKILQGNRYSYQNQLTTVGSANYQALFTIQNSRVFKNRANQCVINLISVSGAIKHTSPVVYYLVRNATLAGNPNFSSYSSDSCSLFDTSATTVSWSDNAQLIWTGHIGDTGEIDHHFGNGSFNAEELTIQPGESITLCAKATTGTPTYVTGSINTREDQ